MLEVCFGSRSKQNCMWSSEVSYCNRIILSQQDECHRIHIHYVCVCVCWYKTVINSETPFGILNILRNIEFIWKIMIIGFLA